MAPLNKQLSNLTAIINKMKTEAAMSIESLREQNPNITPVDGKVRAFTMNSAFLSGDCILDPFYYDWDAQHNAILEKLHKSSIDSFVKSITELVKTGRLDGRRYHPEVTKRLSALVEEV